MIVIFLILKCLGGGDGDNDNVVAAQEVTETEPLVGAQTNIMTYGTNKFHEKEDLESESDALSSSSEELYNEKLCIICYDEQRNCFFVPCGHCATCYDCAQRYTLIAISILTLNLTESQYDALILSKTIFESSFEKLISYCMRF